MFPPTSTRVAENTPQATNERIERETIDNLRRYAAALPEEIEARIAELDREWDIERLLETNAAAIALGGVLLGALVNRKWLILPGVVTGFLFQHALQGWCPPVPLLRNLGVRTASEIFAERCALKILRGDFKGMARTEGIVNAEQILKAVQG